jgi:branched-chain amino acid transport system ATP-binding protein
MRGCARSISASVSMSDWLALHGVSSGYGETVVLDGISLALQEGDSLSVLGRNGVGKTTLLASVAGHTTLHAGRIVFRDQAIEGLRPFRRARLGIGYVPQEREIFPSLNVDENLSVAARAGTRWTRERVYDLFPALAERRRNMGNQLSGGEQQMLAIARAMIAKPDLIMLDEPSEGIMPVLVDEMFELFRAMKAQGTTVLLVEQNVELALDIADRAYVLDQGGVVHHASAKELLADNDIKERYCSV